MSDKQFKTLCLVILMAGFIASPDYIEGYKILRRARGWLKSIERNLDGDTDEIGLP